MTDETADAGLGALVAATRAAADPPALWRVICDWLKAKGVRTVAYHHFRGSLATDPAPLIAASGYPEDVVERYVGERLYRLNPRPDLLVATSDPIVWDDLPRLQTILSVTPDLDGALAAMVDGIGLSLPVFGPQGRLGTFGLGFGGPMPDAETDLPRLLQLGCQLAHLTYCSMTSAPVAEPPALTPREREVLGWIAQGKSNAVIATILGISAHTVDTHVRRIFGKLDVTDRTTAALRGLGAGLVQPAGADAA